MQDEKVKSLIANGYELKMGEYISGGFEIFKKNPGGFILATLILILCGGTANAVKLMGHTNLSYGFSGLGILIQPALLVGFFAVADKLKHNENSEFGDFFKAFGGGFYFPLLGYTILSGICIFIGFILVILPGIYLAVGYTFASSFIYFKGTGIWEAMETSRKVVGKNWFGFFVFAILIGLINVLGLICLGIGLLVTIPTSICAIYVAFNDIVGARQSSTETNIADHLITT